MEGITVKSFGAYEPSLIVTNDDLSKLVETSDQWIVERTGIKERRISTKEDTSELAINASKKALFRAGMDAEALDLNKLYKGHLLPIYSLYAFFLLNFYLNMEDL